MNKAKAMLDALMGPSRDASSKAVTDDWKDRKVCKTFLVAVCPYDKTMLGGRKNVEVCPKIHNEMLREKFNAHGDGAPDSSFRRDCEDRALRELTEVIGARDLFAREQASHKNAQLNIRPAGQNKSIGKMKRQVCEIKEKADAIDDTESVANAALKVQLLKEYALGLEEYEAIVKEDERKADLATPRAQSCKVCGTAYVGDDDYKLHTAWTRHTAYLQIQEHFDRLKEKKTDWDKKKAEKTANADATEGTDAKNSKSDKKDKEKTDVGNGDNAKSDKKTSRSKSKDKDKVKAGEKNGEEDGKNAKSDKKKSRSRSRDKDKARDKERAEAKTDRKKSRSREKDRARDKGKTEERRRSRDRGGDRSRRDRSRSRDNRKRSRSRSHRRDRGRR